MLKKTADTWVDSDLRHVWHPYTQVKTAAAPIALTGGKGAYLYGADGRRYFDAISSWWVNLHGHAHPHIADSIARQMVSLEHVAFADFTHYPAATLAKQLVEALRWGEGRVFYSDNGSTAVETALKMVVQYWHQRGQQTPRRKIVCFSHAFHGDTFGAMAVGGRSHFNRPFWPYLFEVEMIAPPLPGEEHKSCAQLQALVERGDVACFIFEPIVQGAYGMRVHSAAGLDALLNICREGGVITIADEVMTGFGRTGPVFACARLRHQPDIICLSKGLTGGFLPLGATVCREFIYNAFYSDRAAEAFLHGHSYCANPLACAAGSASLALTTAPACTAQRSAIEACHHRFAARVAAHPRLRRCDVAGTILAVEYAVEHNSYFADVGAELKRYFLSQGIFVRPLGNVLYLMPPYCSTEEDLAHVYYHIQQTLEDDLWKRH